MHVSILSVVDFISLFIKYSPLIKMVQPQDRTVLLFIKLADGTCIAKIFFYQNYYMIFFFLYSTHMFHYSDYTYEYDGYST
jgi:hypothetical protein